MQYRVPQPRVIVGVNELISGLIYIIMYSLVIYSTSHVIKKGIVS